MKIIYGAVRPDPGSDPRHRLLHARRAEREPKVETRVVLVNKWFDPPKEAEAAQSMIDQGVDVLMQNTVKGVQGKLPT
jgi:hypothetical protein